MRQIAEARAKAMNLSVVRLCFQAYLPDEKGNFTKPLDPAISNQVYDSSKYMCTIIVFIFAFSLMD